MAGLLSLSSGIHRHIAELSTEEGLAVSGEYTGVNVEKGSAGQVGSTEAEGKGNADQDGVGLYRQE